MALRPSRTQNRSDQLAERNKAQQDVFLREVDDALREDQLLVFARRYGKPLAAVVVVGLVALAGWLWWDSSRDEQAARAGEEFVVALDQIEVGRVPEGRAALQPLAAGDRQGPSAAARLMQAGLAGEQGQPAEARRLLAAVAADEDAPIPFRNLATVREVALAFDSLPPERIVARLQPLAKLGSPWFGSAGELLAAAYLKQRREDLAGPLFAAIAKDPSLPASLRARAQQQAGLLGVDAVVDVDRAAAGTPAVAAGQP